MVTCLISKQSDKLNKNKTKKTKIVLKIRGGNTNGN